MNGAAEFLCFDDDRRSDALDELTDLLAAEARGKQPDAHRVRQLVAELGREFPVLSGSLRQIEARLQPGGSDE